MGWGVGGGGGGGGGGWGRAGSPYGPNDPREEAEWLTPAAAIGRTVGLEVHDMMYGWDAAGLGGWWMLAGMGILALAVVASIWLIVHRPGSGAPRRSPSEEILRERFARGELSREEFDEAKRRLA